MSRGKVLGWCCGLVMLAVAATMALVACNSAPSADYANFRGGFMDPSQVGRFDKGTGYAPVPLAAIHGGELLIIPTDGGVAAPNLSISGQPPVSNNSSVGAGGAGGGRGGARGGGAGGRGGRGTGAIRG